MDIITALIDLLKDVGLNPVNAGGWIVAILAVAFLVWRTIVMDKKLDDYVTKVTKVLEIQQTEWRALVNKTDDITFDMLESSTKTMTTLIEKINTLQMIILQDGRKG